MNYDDTLQHARIGLLRAIRTYDPPPTDATLRDMRADGWQPMDPAAPKTLAEWRAL